MLNEIWQKLFAVHVALPQAQSYFDDIEKSILSFAHHINETNLKNSLKRESDAKHLVDTKSFFANVETEVKSFKTIGTPPFYENENEELLNEIYSDELNDKTFDSYHSESKGYLTFSNTKVGFINPLNDELMNICSLLQKYNRDVLENQELKQICKDCMRLVAIAHKDHSLDEKDKKTLKKYSDELDKHMDTLLLDEYCEFDGQRYLEKRVKQLQDEFDKKKIVNGTFEQDSLDNLSNLMNVLKDNESSLPQDVKQYEDLYNSTKPIDELLGDEASRVSDLFLQLDSHSLPSNVQNAWENIPVSDSDIILGWGGKEPESLPNILSSLQVLLEVEQGRLPNDISANLSNVDSEILLKAIKDNDKEKVAEFATPEVISALNDAYNYSNSTEIPQSIMGDLGALDGFAGALSNLVNMPNMDGVSAMLGELMNEFNLGNILDPQLANIINRLPSNVMDLNLNNLTDLLGVNNVLSDLFGRMEFMNGFTQLSSMIPSSVSQLFGNLPPGMSRLMDSVGNLTNMNSLLSNLSNLADLGQLTSGIQNMLNGALNGISLGNLSNILQSGNLMNISGIAGSLGNIVNGFQGLSSLPLNALSSLQSLPSGLGNILGSLGGLPSLPSLDGLSSMAISLGSTLMGLIPSEAAKLVSMASQIISRIGSEVPTLSHLFGPGRLGDAVPKEYW